MGLPKIDLPRYKHHLKGLDQTVTFRPFTNKEQKILLHAKESNNVDQIVDSVKQIIELCVSEDINVDDMPVFDIEDLFIRIRAKSVSETITIKYKVKGTKKNIRVNINIDDIEVKTKSDHKKTIYVTDSIGIVMRYPTYKDIAGSNDDEEYILRKSIDYIFDEEEVYYFKDFSEEEINEWIDSLDTHTSLKIREFFETMPQLYYETEVDLGEGETEKLVFKGLHDFFS